MSLKRHELTWDLRKWPYCHHVLQIDCSDWSGYLQFMPDMTSKNPIWNEGKYTWLPGSYQPGVNLVAIKSMHISCDEALWLKAILAANYGQGTQAKNTYIWRIHDCRDFVMEVWERLRAELWDDFYR